MAFKVTNACFEASFSSKVCEKKNKQDENVCEREQPRLDMKNEERHGK